MPFDTLNPSIFDYTSAEAMQSLCDRLDIPEEVTMRVLKHLAELDLQPFVPHFGGLFSKEQGPAAVEAIKALPKTEADPTGDDGLRAMTVYLMAAQHTKKMYEAKSLPLDIFYATMDIYNRYVREHMVSYGVYGFDRDFWIWRHHALQLFRIGTLEFEFLNLRAESDTVGPASPGDPVLSVHIPSNARLTKEELEESYRGARGFFRKHYPEYEYKCVYCSTWLLSQTLKQVLRPESGILRFQSHYEITKVDPDANSGIVWIFKRDYEEEDYASLPEDTSLMRNVKQMLLDGGKVGSATGYVKDFETL